MNIKDPTQISGMQPIAPLEPKGVEQATGGTSFAGVLKSSLTEVNQLQQKADAAITALATGDKASLHDTMIAMEQADVSFKLMMQLRNKIVEAYQEIIKIQV
jgi:flagellar hook-basal body complex protein FliE